ncbi:protein TRANSPARENT TESTA GLABRA, putative [Entamoeba dispar SAW760]|uniref:Protein TRANSPARENT TESTA GLABRA, putative n=1 Tax=Entamoeba dispar (strain ATCC PRA-260 / SAW760) TaxID=370354 RepID=B0E9K4_ENTDS|nr:protein TRANSPARENT TESTA GLABRA, putative [Entamoeba dispar SAW760]EDR28811.1 protein TRANSPARENT TESTA GLABRA, putative [Entamoeba dispar SAW760]|eukprot:EDR28811.1 protein TRANSPARENT TESTA GLABRA, putative [Entamoeba dispar SAW760]
MTVQPKQGHLYYVAQSPVMSISWSSFTNAPLRCLYTTFTDTITSHLHILQYVVQSDTIAKTLSPAVHDLPFTPTAAHFSPKPISNNDIFVTSGDGLRVFSLSSSNDINLTATMTDQKYQLPSCGFDWCNQNPDLLCTWYLDNTCCVWNVETRRIAWSIPSKKQIFDMKYCPNSPDVYGIASEQGLLQLNDIRAERPIMLLYQSQDAPDLMKLSWSSSDPNRIATFSSYGDRVVVMDIRKPFEPMTQLKIAQNQVSCIDWSTSSANELCIGTTDKKVMVWVIKPSSQNENSLLEFSSDGEVNDVCWSKSNPEWIGAAMSCSVHYLHV